jgi:hypothetical protein
MSREKRQARLLDKYLDALARNPSAPPPPDLDPEIVEMVTLFERNESQRQSLYHSDRRRIWQQSLIRSTRASKRYRSDTAPGGESEDPFSYMRFGDAEAGLTRFAWPKVSWTLLAAILSMTLFAAILIFAIKNENSPEFGKGSSEGRRATPSVVPSAMPLSDHNATVLGDYALTIPSWQSEPQPISIGETVEQTLSSEQNRWIYVLSGRISGTVTAYITASEPVIMRYRTLERPQVGGVDTGSVGISDGGTGGDTGGASEFEMPMKVHVDEIVRLVVENPFPVDVSYTLTIGAVETPTLVFGESYTTSLETAPVDQQFEFEGKQGDLVDIRVTAAVDTRLTLEAQDGTLIAQDDDSGAGLNPEIYHVQLPQDGRYTIRLSGVGFFITRNDDQFDLTIDVRKVEPITIVKGQSLDILLPDKQPAKVLRYEGQAGETVTLAAETSYVSGIINVEIIQNGKTLTVGELLPRSEDSTGFSVDSTLPQTLTRTFDIQADGDVKVFINYSPPQDQESLDYSINLRVTLN